jgi:DNA-binding response OmpR family regulator
MEKLKVLVADDDPLTVKLLEKLLTSWGYEVVTAYDGESARLALLRGGVRLCVLDWEMPQLSGRDLCAWIHSSDLEHVPYVVLLTAQGNPQNIVDGFAAGADDYVTKPFEGDDLRYRLASFALRIMYAETAGEEPSRVDPIDRYRLDLRRFRKELSRPV